jgi:hypothetical protein
MLWRMSTTLNHQYEICTTFEPHYSRRNDETNIHSNQVCYMSSTIWERPRFIKHKMHIVLSNSCLIAGLQVFAPVIIFLIMDFTVSKSVTRLFRPNFSHNPTGWSPVNEAAKVLVRLVKFNAQGNFHSGRRWHRILVCWFDAPSIWDYT